MKKLFFLVPMLALAMSGNTPGKLDIFDLASMILAFAVVLAIVWDWEIPD